MSDIKLTEEQISEFKEAFRMIDIDGEGSISSKELAGVVKALGQDIPETELVEFINEIDTDGNRTIDFPEFVTLMTKRMKDSDVEEELRETFNAFDIAVNADPSVITGAKIKKLFQNVQVELTDEEVQDMMNEADLDKDGVVSWEDFYGMIQTKKKPVDEADKREENVNLT